MDCFYLIGSCVGPSPYPEMVKFFQKIIGEEARRQLKLYRDGKITKDDFYNWIEENK
jgi:tryptophan synthase beta chain